MSLNSASTTSFITFIRHLKIEAFALAFLMVVLLHKSGNTLWLIPITFLFFDIGMIGYLKNPKAGAMTYNATHSLFVPTLCIAFGALFNLEIVSVIGFLWTFHIAFDRALGYGLKYHHPFEATHLGNIGKKKH